MSTEDTVILVMNNGIGNGPQDLQLTLAGKYFQLLDQSGELPAAICFYTEGVRLVAEGSPVLGDLIALEKKGIRLVVCSTCLNYFGLTDKVRTGIIAGMTDILDAQIKAGKVISL